MALAGLPAREEVVRTRIKKENLPKGWTAEGTFLAQKIQEVSAGHTISAAMQAHALNLALSVGCAATDLENADTMIDALAIDLKRHVRLNWEECRAAMAEQDGTKGRA